MKETHIKLYGKDSKRPMSKKLMFYIIDKIIQTQSDKETVSKRVWDTLDILEKCEIYELPTN